MDICEILVVFLGGVVLLAFISFFVCGKRLITKRYSRILILLFCASVILLSYHYAIQLEKAFERVDALQAEILYKRQESRSFTKYGMAQMLDSLKKKEGELAAILTTMQKQEKITGCKIADALKVTNMMEETKRMIDTIEIYNAMVDSALYGSYSKSISNDTSYFVLFPPSNTDSEYLDFSIKFYDDRIIDEIAVIYIEVYKLENGRRIHVYGQYYSPQKGINTFRLENCFKEEEVQASVGFFWGHDYGKTNPQYENITFSIFPSRSAPHIDGVAF